MTSTGALGSGLVRRAPVLVPAVAASLGVLATVQAGGTSVAVSFVDLACLGVFAAGLVAVVRRRGGEPAAWWPGAQEPALWAYLAFLVVAGAQFVLPSVGGAFDAEVATGASRFVGPAALLLGLTWLRPARADDPWDWRVGFAVLGLVMAAGIAVDAVTAVGDPDVAGFYDWKRALQQPVGVSNIIAGYTAVTFWPTLTLVRRDWRWGAAAATILLATLVTLSRAAVIGLAVALVVVLVGRWRPSRRSAAGLAAAVAALTVVVTVGTIAVDTRPGAEGMVASALRVRDEQFTAAYEAWQDAPLLGVGLNRFQEEVTVVTSQPSAAAVDGVIPYEHPNNAWLMSLAEVGLLGTIAYLALWALLAVRIVRLEDPVMQFALAGAASGLAVHAQLEALTFTRGIEVVLALLLAAAWSPVARGNGGSQRQ